MRLCDPAWCETLRRRFLSESSSRARPSCAGERLVSISIQRFAPTPTAKFGLGLDVAVLVGAVARATPGPIALQIGWAALAVIVFWSISSVVRHYGYAAERPPWEDVLFALVNLLAVATVVMVGGALLPVGAPDVVQMLVVALPLQVMLRLTVFAFVRAQTRTPHELLIVGHRTARSHRRRGPHSPGREVQLPEMARGEGPGAASGPAARRGERPPDGLAARGVRRGVPLRAPAHPRALAPDGGGNAARPSGCRSPCRRTPCGSVGRSRSPPRR